MILSPEEIKDIKATYLPDMRVELYNMVDEGNMRAGLKDTVRHVDDAGQLHVKWDNGSSLALIPGVDAFSVIAGGEPR